MRTSLTVLIAALLLAAGTPGCSLLKSGECECGCAEAKAAAPAGKDEAKAKEEAKAKRKSLQGKLEIAEARLLHAQMELRAQEMSADRSVAYAEKELALAEGKLLQAAKFDIPNRIDREKLNLQRARDMAAEADEELEQIMIMYDEADLEDMTAEFVISRGKRNAERQKKSLAIQELAFKALIDHEIPREKESLEFEVQKKRDGLEKTRLGAESGCLQKKIALMNIETEIADLKDQLDKFAEKADSK